MDEENDLFYHALNYRGARSQDAELFWKDLEACMNRLIAAEREACASMLEMTTAELLLMAGEMTAQELRTVKAVLAQRAASIRMRPNAT